jgi:hypothetical protein
LTPNSRRAASSRRRFRNASSIAFGTAAPLARSRDVDRDRDDRRRRAASRSRDASRRRERFRARDRDASDVDDDASRDRRERRRARADALDDRERERARRARRGARDAASASVGTSRGEVMPRAASLFDARSRSRVDARARGPAAIVRLNRSVPTPRRATRGRARGRRARRAAAAGTLFDARRESTR